MILRTQLPVAVGRCLSAAFGGPSPGPGTGTDPDSAPWLTVVIISIIIMIQVTLREKPESVNVRCSLTSCRVSFTAQLTCHSPLVCVCVLTVANLKLRPEILLFDCSVRTAACGFHQHPKRLPLALFPGRS